MGALNSSRLFFGLVQLALVTIKLFLRFFQLALDTGKLSSMLLVDTSELGLKPPLSLRLGVVAGELL